jgi:hypothetical protein
MTIKISELGNLTAVLGNVYIPLVSNVAGTLTTVKGNVTQLAQYINVDATTYGNIIPSANVVMSLGNVTHRWKDLWISDSTIYLGNTTIKSDAPGEISVAPAPTTLFGNVITNNNLVPGNIWVTGAYANSGSILSATIEYRNGSGILSSLSLDYGTDYEIVPTSGGYANIRVFKTITDLTTAGWIGFGNLIINELSPSVSTIGTAGVSTPSLEVLGVSQLYDTLELRQPGFDSNMANLNYGTVALSVSEDGGVWGGPGALIFEGNNTEGNGIIPSNPSQYTLGTTDFPWLNVYADQITSPTIDGIDLALSLLDANAATQSDSIALLTSNAGVQAGSIATLTANIATLTANAGAQAGSLATITANLGSVAGSLSTITANLGSVSGSIATLTANAASQAEQITQVVSDTANTASAVSSYSPNVQVASYLPIYSGNISGVGNTLVVGGNLRIAGSYVPSANNSTGTAGQVAWDSNYIYICIATNTWKRANISTW